MYRQRLIEMHAKRTQKKQTQFPSPFFVSFVVSFAVIVAVVVLRVLVPLWLNKKK
jgi:hypothetical protein